MEYELAYYDSAVHHFNHYTSRKPPSMSRSRRKNVTNEFFIASPAVSRMPCSSYLDGFEMEENDRAAVAVFFCGGGGVIPEFLQYR